MAWSTSLITQHKKAIVEAVAGTIPVFSEGLELARAGALFTYSADDYYLFRRSAYYIDQILKGVKPGNLPIEQPTHFILVLNLKSASRLRIKIPKEVLIRANELIR
jgi:putative ABC transport system substrate-binding protein